MVLFSFGRPADHNKNLSLITLKFLEIYYWCNLFVLSSPLLR